MINRFICLIKNHKYIEAGSCPYTGNSYMACTRCTKIIPVDKTIE